MSELASLSKLKSKIENLRIKANKAKGVSEQIEDQLQNDWGCESVDVAKKLLVTIKKDAKVLRDKFEVKLKEFKSKYSEELSGV